jgi:hypothetical protein
LRRDRNKTKGENMTTYDNIRKAVIKEIEDQYQNRINQLETEEGLNMVLLQERKQYKKDAKVKLTRLIRQRKDKELIKRLGEISAIEASGELPNDLIVTIEWKPSRMWRSNPRSHTNYGFDGSSIGGCGYDKRSTALAEALNATSQIMKALYTAKDKALATATETNQNDINRKYLGYGSGYGVIPHFEGGVGVESHLSILRTIGFNANWIVDTANTDVFRISTKTENKEVRK